MTTCNDNISLSDVQSNAVSEAKDWFNSKSKEPFVIAGYAGSGKTTCVKYLVKELGLKHDEVSFCAYSGMAASVLTRKGNFATTIHKLIYKTISLIDSKTGKRKFIFKIKTKEEFKEEYPNLKLIVLDEVSMVPDKMINELLTFGVKIICLGDPGQLPPIMGGDNRLIVNPNIFIAEIHRQALENPIIYLSMLARNKEHISYGKHGDSVLVINKFKTDQDKLVNIMSRADQILAGRNNTVNELNDLYRREILNIDTDKNLTPLQGEKIVCLKNNWGVLLNNGIGDTALVNGMIGYMKDKISTFEKAKLNSFNFQPIWSEDVFNNVIMDEMPFIDPKVGKKSEDIYSLYPELRFLRMDSKMDADYFDFAYAITVHKSQGSEYNKVLYLEEVLNRKEHHRALYTAITRAKDKLIIVR